MSEPAAVLPARVLVIDDEPQIRKFLDISLRAQGYRVETAEDGETGVLAMATHGADLVILDLGLPDIDGHEVLRRLRADAGTAGITCVSLSANAMPDDIDRALRAGFADYWTKPLDLGVFMRSLDAIFGNSWLGTTRP